MLKVGVIGVGVWGCHSLEQSLAATGRADVSAVTTCDRWGAHNYDGDPVDVGRQYAAKLDAEFVEDWQKLVNRQDIDLISAMVCPLRKPEVIRAALQAGKHVITDKPLALDARQAEELVKLEAESSGRGFMLAGYQNRPLVGELIRRVHGATFGDTKAISMRLCFMGGIFPGFNPTKRWRSEIPSGELTTIGSHALITLMRLHPVPIRAVSAITANQFYQEYADAGAEDWAEANVIFADGAVASFQVARLPYRVPDEDMVVHVTGTEQYAEVRGNALRVWPGPDVIRAADSDENPLYSTLRAAADAFETDTSPPVTLMEGWRLQTVLDAALESARTGRQIDVAWPEEEKLGCRA